MFNVGNKKSNRWWYTAEQITRATQRGLQTSEAEAIRWLVEGVGFLPDAHTNGDLQRCLEQPVTSIDERWDTLIAASIRYKLRVNDLSPHIPDWTFKQPLETIWFPGTRTPRAADVALSAAPTELRRVGVMLPASVLDNQHTPGHRFANQETTHMNQPHSNQPAELDAYDVEHADRDKSFDRAQIMSLLRALGEHLDAQGLHCSIHVVGGAAIALTLRDGRTTADIDALVSDHRTEFAQAAHGVATSHHVPPTWIGDDVSDFVSRSPAGQETEISLPGLSVFVASPEHLLAMKVRASTTRMSPKDREDLVFLAEHLGLTAPHEVATLTEQQFQGIYRDRIGWDEYVETAREAFVTDVLTRAEREGTTNSPEVQATVASYYIDQEDEGSFDDELDEDDNPCWR